MLFLETQPALTVDFNDGTTLNFHITCQKDRDDWYTALSQETEKIKSDQTVKSDRINKLKSSQSANPNPSSPRTSTSSKWATLKRSTSRKSTIPPFEKETVVGNPLYQKKLNASRRETIHSSSPIAAIKQTEEDIKKSPSTGTFVAQADLSSEERRKQFQRSPSVDSLGKVIHAG